MAFSKIAAENLGGSTLPALGAGSLTGISTALTPMWYVRRNADQALTNNTFTKVEWDSEVIDTDSAFASNKFTVPSGKAGKYYIEANVSIYDMATQEHHYVEIRKDGSNICSQPTGITTAADDTDRYMQTISAVVDLAVGEYIEIYGYVYTGGVDSSATMSQSWFLGYKIG
tara:strand:+ start:1269 stop:1781 length:513 start_codon:yes stop_codon:yes gene_type:complete